MSWFTDAPALEKEFYPRLEKLITEVQEHSSH